MLMKGTAALRRCFRIGLVPCLIVFVVGCGSKGTVTGKVTYKGNDITQGKVIFLTDDFHTFDGNIDKDGNYKVEGVPVGAVKVGLVLAEPGKIKGTKVDFGRDMKINMKDIPPGMEERLGPQKIDIPKAVIDRYKEPTKSPERFVVEGGHQIHDIELKEK